MSRKFLIWLFVVSLVAACGKQPMEQTADEDKTLVRVNGAPITEYDLVYWLRGAHGQEITPEMREGTLDRLVDGELLYQKGRELGLHKNELYRKEIRKLEVQLKAAQRSEMMQRVYNQEVAANIEVAPEAVRRYYDEHKARFSRKLHLGTLRFDTVAEAEAARERIDKGEGFEDLVDLGKDSQWDAGSLPWAKVPLEWHDIVYELEPGQVSEVFEGERTGIRLFKLLGSEQGQAAEFKSVRSSIKTRLQDARARQAFTAYLADLKARADIQRLDSP